MTDFTPEAGMAFLASMSEADRYEFLILQGLKHSPPAAGKDMVAWACVFYQGAGHGKVPPDEFYQAVHKLAGGHSGQELLDRVARWANAGPNPIAPKSVANYLAVIDIATRIELATGQPATPSQIMAEVDFNLDDKQLQRWRKLPRFRADIEVAKSWEWPTD